MVNDSVNDVPMSTTKERNSIFISEDNDNKSRKSRWSSCFSFIKTKFKKSKLQKDRLSQSFDSEFDYVPENNETPVEQKMVKSIGSSSSISTNSASWKQQLNTTSSLSPPPRQYKNKRDSSMSQIDTSNTNNSNQLRDRRPLVDPTLTPRVKPRSIKTSKKQPSLLRLSLDAELLQHQQQQSPDGAGLYSLHDYDSISTISHSSLTFTPTNQQQYPPPFRSGTLGTVKSAKLRLSSHNSDTIPPLPKINITTERPNSQSTTRSSSNISYVTESPTSMNSSGIEFNEEEEKLTLKERRHRRSPLSMPNTDQLTLALNGFTTAESLSTESQNNEEEEEEKEEDDQKWRQQLLEQSIAFSFQNKSRQDAMMTLEGKNKKSSARAISLQPIVAINKLDDHFKDADVVKDKAQYDAIVSRITHKRQLSHEERNNYRTSSPESSTNDKRLTQQQQDAQLCIITENEIITTPISANKMLLFPTTGQQRLSVTPETPPHHQQNAPSLISAPSTPNSIDSSVLEHDDYLTNHQLLSFLSS